MTPPIPFRRITKTRHGIGRHAMHTVLIVDDHPLILDAVRRVFELNGEWSVIEASSYAEAIESMERDSAPALVLLDLGLPGKFGLEALRCFRDLFPETPCVVLSGQDEHENIVGAIELGAMGFISKKSSGTDLMEAVSLILKGYICVPRDSSGSPPVQKKSMASINPMQLGLSARQCEVLAQLVSGKSNKAIARRLNIEETTVKTHVLAVYRLLNVNNRTSAVMAVSRMRIQLSLFER
jgi:DNA-binding NarL/FixJ family response regulator